MTTDVFAPLRRDEKLKSRCDRSEGRVAGNWIPITPVPDDAPAPPDAHPTLGPPVAAYEYRDEQGQLYLNLAVLDLRTMRERAEQIIHEVKKAG